MTARDVHGDPAPELSRTHVHYIGRWGDDIAAQAKTGRFDFWVSIGLVAAAIFAFVYFAVGVLLR